MKQVVHQIMVGFAIFCAALSFVTESIHNIQLSWEIQALRNQVSYLQSQNETLKGQTAWMQSDRNLYYLAQSRLNLTVPNGIPVYVLPFTQPRPKISSGELRDIYLYAVYQAAQKEEIGLLNVFGIHLRQ